MVHYRRHARQDLFAPFRSITVQSKERSCTDDTNYKWRQGNGSDNGIHACCSFAKTYLHCLLEIPRIQALHMTDPMPRAWWLTGHRHTDKHRKWGLRFYGSITHPESTGTRLSAAVFSMLQACLQDDGDHFRLAQ
eukprot:scpid83178/ scgid19193/ 